MGLQPTDDIRGAGRIHLAAGVALPEAARSQKMFTLKCLVEAWVPACSGKAREVHCEIVNVLVDANWITTSSAGAAF